MKNYFILIAFLSITFTSLKAQELNCSVQINSTQVQGSDKSIYDVMKKNIYEFMNNKKWTNNIFKNNEKIECTILINITERVSTNQFKATLQVQSRRPIFNTSYNSTLLNYIDKEFDFSFNEFDNLDYSETTYISNLTSVLSYYAYIIIALDYDSYSLKGGTPYLKKAQTIVTNAQSANTKGWKSYESNTNRYWLVENLLHPNFSPLRECYYNYHRLGFDVMAVNMAKGRAVVFESIKKLEKVHIAVPNSYILQMFFNAKSDELISLFKGGLPREKTEITAILSKINAINASQYAKILKGK